MGDRREKCSGKPERKGGRFPYRPKDAPRSEPLANVPGPEHARFASIRPFFRQRKDDAERRRREQLEQQRRRVEEQADAKARRGLEREEAERQRGIDAFWRTMNRKVRGKEQVGHRQPKQGRKQRAGVPRAAKPPHPLTAYNAPIVDRQGRRGLFMSSSYLSAKTSAYGCMTRLSYYVTKPDSLEELEGEQAFFSNMGETRHEIASGMALVEDANRAARANAKVAITFIVQLPHDVTPEERLRILRIWCEEKLGVHDLPFVAAIHKPSRDGDQRNTHGHVVTSFRPAYRTGRYEWRIAQGLRTELDNPAMFEEFRRDFATIMTAVVQVAGIDRVYTHLSHAARGLKHKPTGKLGSQQTRAVRDGEYVPADARNARTIAANETLAEVERIDERAAKLRGRMEQLARLKAGAARNLFSTTGKPVRNDIKQAHRVSPAGYTPQPVNKALLAAADRVTVAMRQASNAGWREQQANSTLADVPSLQDAAMLDDTVRLLSSVAAETPATGTSRPPSWISVQPNPIRYAVRTVIAPDDVVRDEASLRVVPDRPVVSPPVPAVSRAPSRADRVDVVEFDIQTVSSSPAVGTTSTKSRQLGPVPSVARSMHQVKSPSALVLGCPTPAVMGRNPTAINELTMPAVELRRPAAMTVVQTDPIASTRLTSATDLVPQFTASARRSDPVRHVVQAEHEAVRCPDLSPARLARVARLVDNIEREAKVQADTAKAQAAKERRSREHDRFIRFLALLALNPDWLEDGHRGPIVAMHAPSKAKELHASWQNDAGRIEIVAEIRQATFDGIHRLPAELAADVERVAEAFSPQLPPPPPLRDRHGQLAPTIELAMALVADNPGWIAASGDPSHLSVAASPALSAIIARYQQDRALPSLLVSAMRHGQGVPGTTDVMLARRIDQHRAGMALRRASGGLPVLTPDRTRLSPAMVDHLAQARRHPDWIIRGKHLGLGLDADASSLFRQQWAGWKEPKLARQLVLDVLAPAASAHSLTPVMRTQVMDRVRALAGPAEPGKRTMVPRKDELSR